MYQTVSINTANGDLADEYHRAGARGRARPAACRVGFVSVSWRIPTAAITINSPLDANTARDIVDDIRRLVPTRTDFHHIFDTPSDAAAHIKASLIGNTETVLIENGDLVLGHSQGLLFFDFDGPRKRQVMVKIIEG